MKKDIIVIGASAGGVTALQRLVRGLPPDFSAAILIVLHRIPYLSGLLPEILERAGMLPVRNAVDGDVPRAGHIYLAPPDRHLLLERGALKVTRGQKENYSRPAIDPLFRSAALHRGPSVVGVILSGTLIDGTLGLAAVKQEGGYTIVQDPRDAAYSEMPENAIARVMVDRILPIDEIAKSLVELSRGAVDAERDPPTDDRENGEGMSPEIRVSARFNQMPAVLVRNRDEQISGEKPKNTTFLTRPARGGTFWQACEGPVVPLRCHVGHAYSAEGVAAQQEDVLERSLWLASRDLQEGSLFRPIAENALKRGNQSLLKHFDREGRLAEDHSATRRQTSGASTQNNPKNT